MIIANFITINNSSHRFPPSTLNLNRLIHPTFHLQHFTTKIMKTTLIQLMMLQIMLTISMMKKILNDHDYSLTNMDSTRNAIASTFRSFCCEHFVFGKCLKKDSTCNCDKQRYYLDLAKSRGRIGSIASQQCLYQLSILCK